MKKILIILLIVVVLLSVGGITAYALWESQTEDTEDSATITVTYEESQKYLVYEEVEDGTYYVVGYTGLMPNVVIPATYNDKAVTGIATGAFMNNKIIESVTLGANVAEVEYYAFSNAVNLASLTITANVAIADYAFVNVGANVEFGLTIYTENEATITKSDNSFFGTVVAGQNE
ncbi:MAG: leucine-rich repeat protein [Bacillota bacterium]